MEGTKSHPRIREQRLHALPHFCSSLCSKSQRQNFLGNNTAKNAVLNPFGQNRCFSRARPCKNQELGTGVVVMQYSSPLVRIQSGQDAFGIHNASLGNGAQLPPSGRQSPPPLSIKGRTYASLPRASSAATFATSPLAFGEPPSSRNTKAPNRLRTRLTK